MEIITVALALALVFVIRDSRQERAWRIGVEAECDEWRRKDREQWMAAEQAEDDALFADDEAAWGRN